MVTDFDGTGILDDEIHLQKNVGVYGRIALQLHASDELLIRFKDIKIKAETSENFTKQAIETLQKWYNPETGLWQTTGWCRKTAQPARFDPAERADTARTRR